MPAAYNSLLMACLWLLHSSALMASSEDTCPAPCTCLSDGKDGTVVKCYDENLSHIPTNFPKNTAEVLLRKNNIQHIPGDIFPKFQRLSKVDLSFNKIDSIAQHAFPNMLNYLNLSNNLLDSLIFAPPKFLRLLDISYNKIEELHTYSFCAFPVLDTLLINGNSLSRLSPKMFDKMSEEGDCKTLKKLSVAFNKIDLIEDGTFTNLNFLQAFSIASNRLKFLTNGTFKGLNNLIFLDASSNDISHIDNGSFHGLKSIQYLYLKENKLTKVPLGVPMAEWLDLSKNLISRINESDKDSLYTSEFFNLANNPLHCDCKLLWLKELWDRREHQVKHFDSPVNFIPSCETPADLKGDTWDELGDDMFQCENDTESTVSQIEELDLDEFKSEINKIVYRQRMLDIHPVLINVTADTFTLSWDLLEGFTFEPGSLEIHYHQFGHVDSMKHIILTFESHYVTVGNLIPDTGYVICINLLHLSRDMHTPLSQCIEVFTAPLPYVFSVDISLIVTVNSFILKVLGSIIFAISFVGFAAVVLGAVTSQSQSWSSDLSDHEIIRQRVEEEKITSTNTKRDIEGKSVKTD